MEKKSFQPKGLATFIGSLPLSDHREALDLILGHEGEIPPWAQLPKLAGEGMVEQFSHGLPGLTKKGGDILVDTEAPDFTERLTEFYEEALAAAEAPAVPDDSRFALTPAIAPGFFAFEEAVRALPAPPPGVKGQVTGPFTMAVSVKDGQGRAVFYDERVLDCVSRLIAQKARWQARRLLDLSATAIVFLDEPALTGFGSSAYLGVSREQAAEILTEAATAVRAEGGLAGIHVCGNTDWSLVLNLPIDIVNFDAYSFAEAFLAYGKDISAFLGRGGVIAWGAVPTSRAEDIDRESVDSLFTRFTSAAGSLAALGFSFPEVAARSLISPACGLGSQDEERARKAMALTRGLAAKVREAAGA